jgi:predicted Zn-ribbon and HTH transcriptional regulator
MPSWNIHNKWAFRLGVRKDIADLVNRMVDSIGDPEYHDYGRVIVGGHWVFSELYRELQRYYKLFGDDGVKAFLIHHVLDYMSTLLHSPSVSLNRALEYAFKLLSGIEEDSRRFVEDLELRKIIINCCEEIKRLITNNDELLSDIKPELSQWLKWAGERLVLIKCEKCGQEFTTLDEEARRFLASLLIHVLELYIKYCPKCRTITPKLFSEWIIYERRRVIEEGAASPFGSPFHRIYWKPMDEAGDRIWGEIWGKTDALIHVLRARELEEA